MKFLKMVTMCSVMLLAINSYSQGLFENASSDSLVADAGSAKSLDLSGYVKGAVFGGQSSKNDVETKGAYAQTSLKLAASKSDVASLFTEACLSTGKVRGDESVALTIREAWGALDFTHVSIKIGRQIIAWGRADAVNPTNTITPKDELVLSSENDDTRLGNELVQAKLKFGSSSFQGLWIPLYRPDVLTLDNSVIPSGVTIGDTDYPDIHFKNSGYALRLDLTGSSIDGSVSYFNGYATMPGFNYTLSATGMTLIPSAYRMQMIGGDFSTAAGSVGIRAEAAARLPIHDYENDVSVPNPYIQWVLGLDKSIGDWSILVQYSGLYVVDYKKIVEPQLQNVYDPLAIALYSMEVAQTKMEMMNRQFTGTSDESAHSVTANIQWNTLHETLHLKLAGFYNFTTVEYAIAPSIAYDVADAVSLSVGGRYIDGKEESLNNLVSDLMSYAFTELKISF